MAEIPYPIPYPKILGIQSPELKGPPLIVTIEDVDGEPPGLVERERIGRWVQEHVGEYDPEKAPEILLMLGRCRIRVRRLVIEDEDERERVMQNGREIGRVTR